MTARLIRSHHCERRRFSPSKRHNSPQTRLLHVTLDRETAIVTILVPRDGHAQPDQDQTGNPRSLPKSSPYGFAPRFVRRLQRYLLSRPPPVPRRRYSLHSQLRLRNKRSRHHFNQNGSSPAPFVSTYEGRSGVRRPPQRVPHTLIEALAATYSYQPALQAERAKLRATDENVPTALAGWRPTVVLAGNAGYGSGLTRELLTTVTPAENFKILNPRQIAAAQATLTQNLYTGGKVSANVNLSKNQVMAERATLIATEQTSFNNAVSAYVGVIQSKQLLDLQINNEQVLADSSRPRTIASVLARLPAPMWRRPRPRWRALGQRGKRRSEIYRSPAPPSSRSSVCSRRTIWWNRSR